VKKNGRQEEKSRCKEEEEKNSKEKEKEITLFKCLFTWLFSPDTSGGNSLFYFNF